MAASIQLSLPFACLEFHGRSAVTAAEIAGKLGCTPEHIIHKIEDGTIAALDLARHAGSRRTLRVPVDEYRRYVLARLTGPARTEFLSQLPPQTLREIAAEIAARLVA